MTAYLHSRDMGYKDFWAIDADDMGLYAEPQKIVEIFYKVRECAVSRKIDSLSIDTWVTTSKGNAWTFGIVYTNNSTNWFKVMTEHCQDIAYKNDCSNIKTNSGINLDTYFYYLSKTVDVNIGTFYVENLYFIHHIDTPVYFPERGARYWHDGRLYLLPICETLGFAERGSIPVPSKCIKIDIGLKLEEGQSKLREVAAIYDSHMKSFDLSDNFKVVFENKKITLKSTPIFYLKVNSIKGIAKKLLEYWFDCLETIPDKKIYIILDNKNKEHFSFFNETFDYVSRDCYEIVSDSEDICLMPFSHANNMGYKNFWLINADSVGLYANPYRISELLNNVEKYSKMTGGGG